MVGVAHWTSDNTVGPSGLDHELAAVLVVGEKLHRLQERFGCIIGVHHGYYSTLNEVVCQVLYLSYFHGLRATLDLMHYPISGIGKTVPRYQAKHRKRIGEPLT
jgi:hypothetical protein